MRPVAASVVSAVFAALMLAGAAPPDASAAGAPTAATRFDDRVMPRRGGVLAVAPIPLEALAPGDPWRREWDRFLDRHGRGFRIWLDERSAMPTLVFGRGIELFPADGSERRTLDDVERAARELLAAEELLRGEGTGLVELDREASTSPRPGSWRLVFRQSVDGVRVENSRLDLHVDRGRLTLFGASNWARLEVGGVPEITATEAGEILDRYLGGGLDGLEPLGAPRLTLLALDADPAQDGPRRWNGARGAGVTHALVWRLRFRDPASPALWVAEIDARDGSVRAYYDGADYAAVRGGVYPVGPDVGCGSGGCELDGYPMPHADWTEAGQATAVADAYGNLVCSDPQATFETRLAGPYAVVADECGPLLETAACDGPLELGTKAGENCEVAPGASPGNTAAARSAYYHVNRVHEVARFYNPGLAWLDVPVTIHTNWDSTCNASYGGNALYLYRSGGSSVLCANTGELDGIVTHEWGHGLDENDGGGWDNTSEAYADIVAMLDSRQSCFGKGLRTGGGVCSGYGDTCLTCTGFRDHDWAARQANTPATPQGFVQTYCSPGPGPCGYGVHCETYPIDEAIYDLATRDLPAAGMDPDSAWQLVERLWYTTRVGSGGDIYTCALPASDSCAASSWYQRLRSADDDDADLSNGTPHAASLYAAFARHDIACGAAGDAENQSTSSCPTLDRPQLRITASESGPRLEWAAVPGAAQYVLYRGDLGCDRQLVPLMAQDAAVTAWVDPVPDPGLARSYRVEAVGANPACHGPVSSCEVFGAGPRLQLNGHRVLETGDDVNGNGVLDPGETVELPITLFNGGTADAEGVTGHLRTVAPEQGRVLDPVVGFSDVAVGEAVESPAPHFRLTLFEDGVSCGAAVPLELEMGAAGAPPRTRRFDLLLGERQRDFVNSTSLSIPRLTPTPVTSTLDITEDQTIAELDVSVRISHPNPSELVVDVTSPQGTTVRLHDHGTGTVYTRYDLETEPAGPGTMADFEGESTLGVWTLAVQDTIFGGLAGTLSGFTLHVTAEGGFDCTAFPCAEPVPPPVSDTLTVAWSEDAIDGSRDLSFSWDGVAGASGYHVLQSSDPTYTTRVDLTGSTGGATALTVDNGVDATPPLTYFRVRTINGCNQESP